MAVSILDFAPSVPGCPTVGKKWKLHHIREINEIDLDEAVTINIYPESKMQATWTEGLACFPQERKSSPQIFIIAGHCRVAYKQVITYSTAGTRHYGHEA